MKKLILLCFIAFYTCLTFHFFVGYNFSELGSIAIMTCAIIAQFGALILMRRSSGGELDKSSKQADLEISDEEFHNDFSKVGSGEQPIDVKPIDLSGNVYLHNEETFREDLQNMGIDPFKKKDD